MGRETHKHDSYGYSWVDFVWTEAVTRVHEQEPDPVAMQTTRRLNIYSRVGNLVEQRTELMTAAGVWEQIDGVAYEYNVNGRETKRTTFNGLITTSEWAGTCCGKSSETAPDGTRTTFTYDDSGRLIVRTVLDPNPIETHIGYDALGRQTVTWTTNRVAHLGTTPLHTTYDALGRVISQTDNLGNATTYSYSANERTTTVTQPTGATQTTATDEAGRIVSVSGTAVAPRFYTYGVNPAGTRWTKVFSGPDATAASWTKTTRDLLGRTIREEKPGFGNTLLSTTYTYDNGGRVLNQTQNVISGSVSSVLSVDLSTYDRYGHQTFTALDVNHNGVIDFAGPDRVTGTTSTYIAKDNALWRESSQSVYPDFNSDRAVTTAKSRRKLTNLGDFTSVSESEDIRKNVSSKMSLLSRDNGRVIEILNMPTSVSSKYRIYNYGRLVESVTFSSITNSFEYDGLGHRVASKNGRGLIDTIVYNSQWQVQSLVSAATNRVSYLYDSFGRKVRTTDALGSSIFTEYDLRGNIVKQYGATCPVWYSYDAEGRMTAVATTRDTTLDPVIVDSLDNPSLDITQWIYDEATGLLTQKLNADGKGPKYGYTADGKAATKKWVRGVDVTYVYNAVNLPVYVSYSDETPSVAFTYSRLGSLSSAIVDGIATNEYSYSTNTLDLVFETQGEIVVEHSQDRFGRASGVSIGTGYNVQYGHDAFGRFSTVEANLGNQIFTNIYSYLPGSDIIMSSQSNVGNGWIRNYDPIRNLISSITNHFNGAFVSAFSYVNDEAGRRIARRDTRPASREVRNEFKYNLKGEVVFAYMGTNMYGFSYDPIGNRISSTNNSDITSYTTSALNQYSTLTNTEAILLVYDEDGNMLTNGLWSYQWDGENRLRSVSSNSVLVATYTYDYQSRRIAKILEDKVITYFYDGWNLITETVRDESSSYITGYVWGVDVSDSRELEGGAGALLAVMPFPHGETQGDYRFFVPYYDGNGNITEYLDDNGNIVSCYQYSPFGVAVEKPDCGNLYFSFRFSSKYWDDENTAYFYGYRYYLPLYGCWLNRDPIGESGGINTYGFLLNNPLSSRDAYGLCNASDDVGWDWGDWDPGKDMNEYRGKAVEKCKAAKKAFFAANDTWRKDIEDVEKKSNCEVQFECICCDDNNKPPPPQIRNAGGVCSQTSPLKSTRKVFSIYICADRFGKIGEAEQSNYYTPIAHEYKHYSDMCREDVVDVCKEQRSGIGNLSLANRFKAENYCTCAQGLCNEFRAYSYDGSCGGSGSLDDRINSCWKRIIDESNVDYWANAACGLVDQDAQHPKAPKDVAVIKKLLRGCVFPGSNVPTPIYPKE